MPTTRDVHLKEAAALTGFSIRTLRRWCSRHRIDAYRPGGSGPWRVSVDCSRTPARVVNVEARR